MVKFVTGCVLILILSTKKPLTTLKESVSDFPPHVRYCLVRPKMICRLVGLQGKTQYLLTLSAFILLLDVSRTFYIVNVRVQMYKCKCTYVQLFQNLKKKKKKCGRVMIKWEVFAIIRMLITAETVFKSNPFYTTIYYK